MLKWILVFLSVFTFTSMAETTSLKPSMNIALESFTQLMPYLSNEMKFSDPNHDLLIKGHIEKLHSTFKKVSHRSSLQEPLYQSSVELIKTQLSEVTSQFNVGYKNMARIRLQNTLAVCASCHTQLPADKVSSFSLGIKKINKNNFESPFDYAEFLFLVRNFKEAQAQFQKSIDEDLIKIKELKKISSSPVESYSFKSLHESFRKVFQILIKIQANPNGAKEFIKRYSTHKDLPILIKSELVQWDEQLSLLVKKGSLNIKSEDDVSVFIQQYLFDFEKQGLPEDGYEMILLYASGALSRYLHSKPDSIHSPIILFWMGVISHRLNLNLFFDWGEIYLVSCMNKFPKDPVAKKCLKEFENQITFSFTGSGGTDIPRHKLEELSRYKKMIK